MAAFHYREADSAPGQGKVCISNSFSTPGVGVSKNIVIFFVISAFLQLSAYPKLNWNRFKFAAGLGYSHTHTHTHKTTNPF